MPDTATATRFLPAATDLGLALALSLFLGLAFEEYFATAATARPGGIRTFPLLALGGAALYSLDATHFVPFTAGLLVLGAWLTVFYWNHQHEKDQSGEPAIGLIVPILNVHAYLLGAITLAFPHWIAVGLTVAAVLLLTGRERLHALARRVETQEIVTAGKFLILAGIALPLMPVAPVTTLTNITPRQVWVALVVISSLSYASYLAQRYWPPAARGLWMAALGGLYSSTAMTVVLARQIHADVATRRRGLAGITLATGIMYLRILAVIAVFNVALARSLVVAMLGLAVIAFVISAAQYRMRDAAGEAAAPKTSGGNPLEIGAATLFAVLFLVVSVASGWTVAHFGTAGVYTLAAIVGVTDIDPFVLNLAQGGAAGITMGAAAAAILIAASSNNLLKAGYAMGFAGRAATGSAAALVGLAILGVGLAVLPTVLGWPGGWPGVMGVP